MSRESQDFKRHFLLKQPEFVAKAAILKFLASCERRRKSIGMTHGEVGYILNQSSGKVEQILSGKSRSQILQYAKLAHALGCHIELRLVVDEAVKDVPKHYTPKPGGPDHRLADVAPDLSRHPLAQEGPEDTK